MFQLLLPIIYLAFISLGLPDSLLGSAWPSMYTTMNVPISYAGIVSMIIAAGTIISSLFTDRLTRKLSTGKLTAISVAMTALALFGFSISSSFWMLCLWAIPYGLGAGSVDASLNNYVALYYSSRHMSWLHCMWGIGTSIGPYIMGFALTNGSGWHMGYRYISIMQIVLTFILIISLSLWKDKANNDSGHPQNTSAPLSLPAILKFPGAKEAMITFFCYCALESTTGLWASSYLVLHNGVNSETAATYASLFYIGITIGRGVTGFVSLKFSDAQLTRLGQVMIVIGILVLLTPYISIAGLIFIGLGCAPIFPCMLHATPTHFGYDNSQAIMGAQMACSYVGTCLMPPIFGLIANHINIALFPLFLFVIIVLMIFMHTKLLHKVGKKDAATIRSH